MSANGPYDDWRAFLSEPLKEGGDVPPQDFLYMEGLLAPDFELPELPNVVYPYPPETIEPSALLCFSPLLTSSPHYPTTDAADSLTVPLNPAETVAPAADVENAIELLLTDEKLDSSSEQKSATQPSSTSSFVTPVSSEPSVAESETSDPKDTNKKKQRTTVVEEEEEDIIRIMRKAEREIKEAKKLKDPKVRKLAVNQQSSMISRCKKKLEHMKMCKEIQTLKSKLAEVKAENAKLKLENESLKQKEEGLNTSQTTFQFNLVKEAHFHVQYNSPSKEENGEKRGVQVKTEPKDDKELLSRSDTAVNGNGRPIRARRKTKSFD